ncbi:hypothetical protein ABZW44_22620 [Streptomyces mirabilis]|uniref:hypothetical protein n=1 Tax=Streptomyces mirabilis TaxID=68239 RepID=UPI0033A9EAB3
MIKPDGDDYYATTHVVHEGTLAWSWNATLCQPWPALNDELDRDGGWCFTEKRANRKADRAARRMMRAAKSWTTRTYKPAEDPS